MKLAIALVAVCACARDPAPAPLGDRIELALRRGGWALAARQRADGALPSVTYSALRDGWSMTPLAALALRMVPRTPGDPLDAPYRRAVDYVAGVAGRASPEVHYPLYAYAIGALVLGAPDNRRHAAAHARVLDQLRGLQLAERTGWSPADASYGGWGYSAAIPVRPAGAIDDPYLTANLSATLLATGALVLGGARPDDPALVAARRFVDRCQNRDTDGGFFFSPALPVGNKAGLDAHGPRSYGSMSADGLRALLRLGAPLDDPRVAAALGYLDRRFDPARNPGDFAPVDEVRRDSSYYYWAWTVAHAARHLQRRAWAEALAGELVARQQLDGTWRNPATEMREDDPIIATSFAIAALALARSVLVGEPRSHAY